MHYRVRLRRFFECFSGIEPLALGLGGIWIRGSFFLAGFFLPLAFLCEGFFGDLPPRSPRGDFPPVGTSSSYDQATHQDEFYVGSALETTYASSTYTRFPMAPSQPTSLSSAKESSLSSLRDSGLLIFSKARTNAWTSVMISMLDETVVVVVVVEVLLL